MKKRLFLPVGASMLLAGWFSAFFLNSVPQQRTFYIIVPTLLLGAGMGCVLKAVGGKLTAVTLALTALTALLTFNQIFPQRGVGISAFQRNLQADYPALRSITVLGGQNGDPAEEPALEAFAPLEVRVFSRLPGSPGALAFGDNGRLFVSLPDLGAVYQLTDRDQDGFAEQPQLYYVGLDRPSGLAWHDGRLYVAEPEGLLSLADGDNANRAGRVRRLFSGLPDDGGHWRRPLAVGPDSRLYLAVGSRCNACEESNPLRAKVLRIDPQSGKFEVYAEGLRHTTALTFSAQNELWGCDVGREGLGATAPVNEINRISGGGDYGWPYCYGEQRPDPQFGDQERCRQTIAGRLSLPGDNRPTAMVAGHGLKAADEYRNSLYVMLAGRETKLIRLALDPDRDTPVGHAFLRGWGKEGGLNSAQASLVVGPDGHLYLALSGMNVIYQIRWGERGTGL